MDIAPLGAAPLVVTFAFPQAAVEHRDVRLEPGVEPAHGLRRQRYLRHEDDGVPALCEGVFDGLKVYLGLAGTGDAAQQERLERAAVDGLGDGLVGGPLLVVQAMFLGGVGVRFEVGTAEQLAILADDEALLFERAKRSGGGVVFLAEVGHAA